MNQQNLDESSQDKLVSAIRIVTSIIPSSLAGSLIAEITSAIIPNQRLDRIVAFIKELEDRIGSLESNFKDNQYAVDLLEDAIKQAARSLSEERNRYLAIFVSKLGDVKKADHSVKKKLLYLLEELTDVDIDILRSFRDEGASDRFKYQPPFRSEVEVSRLTDSEKFESDLLQVSYDVHLETLERLSLLEPEFQAPEFIEGHTYIDENEAKLPKKNGCHISALGRVLLDSIEL